eukprot:3762764-Rhodomonas_salina.2
MPCPPPSESHSCHPRCRVDTTLSRVDRWPCTSQLEALLEISFVAEPLAGISICIIKPRNGDHRDSTRATVGQRASHAHVELWPTWRARGVDAMLAPASLSHDPFLSMGLRRDGDGPASELIRAWVLKPA